MKIEIKKLSDAEKKELNIQTWPVWNKEISKFDWFYDTAEYCLILEGHIFVETEFERVEIKAGDFVKFPKGLKCVWDIKKPVKKHYKFD